MICWPRKAVRNERPAHNHLSCQSGERPPRFPLQPGGAFNIEAEFRWHVVSPRQEEEFRCCLDALVAHGGTGRPESNQVRIDLLQEGFRAGLNDLGQALRILALVVDPVGKVP